jgi:hypothetical protein
MRAAGSAAALPTTAGDVKRHIAKIADVVAADAHFRHEQPAFFHLHRPRFVRRFGVARASPDARKATADDQ